MRKIMFPYISGAIWASASLYFFYCGIEDDDMSYKIFDFILSFLCIFFCISCCRKKVYAMRFIILICFFGLLVATPYFLGFYDDFDSQVQITHYKNSFLIPLLFMMTYSIFYLRYKRANDLIRKHEMGKAQQSQEE